MCIDHLTWMTANDETLRPQQERAAFSREQWNALQSSLYSASVPLQSPVCHAYVMMTLCRIAILHISVSQIDVFEVDNVCRRRLDFMQSRMRRGSASPKNNLFCTDGAVMCRQIYPFLHITTYQHSVTIVCVALYRPPSSVPTAFRKEESAGPEVHHSSRLSILVA